MDFRRAIGVKYVLGPMVLMLAIGIAGCSGGGSAPAASPSATPTPSPTPTAAPTATPTATATPAPVAGPPYPDPVSGSKRVYDRARMFTGGATTRAEAAIAATQTRTGIQIFVYTQIKPTSNTLAKANADAKALIDQWGLNGSSGKVLVIMFDMESSMIHGQVSLYAGAGAAARISGATRQAIFDDDMLPLLKRVPPDYDDALAIALTDINKDLP